MMHRALPALTRAGRWITKSDPTARTLLELENKSPTIKPNRRAVAAAIIFALGIVAAESLARMSSLPSSTPLFFLAAGLGVIAVLFRGYACLALLAVAVFTAGAAHTISSLHERPHNDIARVLTNTDAIIRVEGTIAGPIKSHTQSPGTLARFSFANHSTSFRLHAHELVGLDGTRTATVGTLLVRVNQTEHNIKPGQHVRLTGLARALNTPANPGAFNAPRWGASNNISGRIRLDSFDLIAPIPSTNSQSALSTISSIRGWLTARTNAWLDTQGTDERRSLIAAMIIGERDDEFEHTQQTFRRVGLAHVLAISGLHLTAMIYLSLLALRLTGDRPKLQTALLLLALAAYLLIVPARTPIVRASILSLALIAADLAGRRYDRLNLLGWVMLAVLIWKPAELFSAGFHLSFGVVAALMLLASPLRARLFSTQTPHDERTVRSCALDSGKNLLCASIVAWTIAAPIVAHHFGIVSLVGIPATVIIMPFVTVLLAVAYLALAVGLVSTAAAGILALAADQIAGLILSIARAIETIPFAEITVHAPPVWWVFIAVACITWWLARGTIRAPIGFALTPALILSIALTWTAAGVPRSVALRIDMLSVGDGTCILLRTQRQAMLFDCGSRYPGIGLTTIPNALRALGVRTVPTVIISHPNTDHFNGLPDFAHRFGVRTVITSAAFEHTAQADPDGAPAALIDFCNSVGIAMNTAHEGDTLALGNLALAVISPPEGVIFDGLNDNSLVILVRIATDTGETSLLLTGDIEREAIARILDDSPSLRADIAEIPHHGSARASAMAFIEALDPTIALQSTGPSRLDDNRWEDVRENRDWRVTARDGAISITIYQSGDLKIESFRDTQ